MEKTDNKVKKEMEFRIPFFIPIIIILVFFLLSVKLYPSNANVNDEVKEEKQEEMQEEVQENIETTVKENIVEEEIPEEEILEEQIPEEQKTITYTASNGKQYDVIATLNIPSLGIEYPILSTTSPELLKVSLNKYWGANPNEVGNMVIIGHNYKNSKFFGKLLNIEIGEIVKIADLTGRTLDYKVYDTYVIDPNDNACTSQLTNGQTEITLITCYYENGSAHATKRFVVKARAD